MAKQIFINLAVKLIHMKTIIYISVLSLLSACSNSNSTSNPPIGQQQHSNTSQTAQTNPLEKKMCAYGSSEVSSLGIGLIIMPADTFDIFEDSLLTHKSITINMYGSAMKEGYCPLFAKADYGIMHYICLAKMPQAYKILVNDAEIKYVPRTNKYTYKAWEDYLIENTVSYLNEGETSAENRLVRQLPDEKSDIINTKGVSFFHAFKVKGEWLKVKWNENEKPYLSDSKTKYKHSGWLRWRIKNKLLIISNQAD